jgi:hypothetical protein
VGKARATIHGGICGFVTHVAAEADDAYDVRVTVETDCPRVQSYTAGLEHLNMLAELGRGHDATVLAAARDPRHGACVGCVIAAGIYKTIHAAAGLSLPAESKIEIESEPS